MPLTIPTICVGEPVSHGSLSVFPLFCETRSDVEYRLSDEALGDKSLVVTEVSEQGSVPELLVTNNGDTRVLFLEGEELIGAKQNRVLNTSVLVAAHSKLKIPVSCVEQGRWQHLSRHFGSSGSHSPSKLRHVLKKSVSRSVREGQSYASDQIEVWGEVAKLHADHAVRSGTAAMSDAFVSHQDTIAEFQNTLRYVENATGIAIAIADQVISFDLFDKPSTCKKVWSRLLSGIVFDALAASETKKSATANDVQRYVDATSELDWMKAKAVGEGEEFRAESTSGDHASALALDQTLVHGSMLASV